MRRLLMSVLGIFFPPRPPLTSEEEWAERTRREQEFTDWIDQLKVEAEIQSDFDRKGEHRDPRHSAS